MQCVFLKRGTKSYFKQTQDQKNHKNIETQKGLGKQKLLILTTKSPRTPASSMASRSAACSAVSSFSHPPYIEK